MALADGTEVSLVAINLDVGDAIGNGTAGRPVVSSQIRVLRFIFQNVNGYEKGTHYPDYPISFPELRALLGLD